MSDGEHTPSSEDIGATYNYAQALSSEAERQLRLSKMLLPDSPRRSNMAAVARTEQAKAAGMFIALEMLKIPLPGEEEL